VSSNNQSLSIIVPIKNSSKKVARTFESILNQTVKPEKFIIVYDDSSDNTLEV